MSSPKSQWSRELKRVRDEGFEEGLQKGRQEILDFLEYAYLKSPTQPDRGTPEAEAILKIATDASQHIQSRMKSAKKGSRK
jgi:hypothetical protein